MTEIEFEAYRDLDLDRIVEGVMLKLQKVTYET